MFEPISQQLTANSYQLNKTTDNSLTVASNDELVDTLAVTISSSWKHCVVGHIQHFGFRKVQQWAEIAATKNKPEQYLMTILSRQRYGKR